MVYMQRAALENPRTGFILTENHESSVRRMVISSIQSSVLLWGCICWLLIPNKDKIRNLYHCICSTCNDIILALTHTTYYFTSSFFHSLQGRAAEKLCNTRVSLIKTVYTQSVDQGINCKLSKVFSAVSYYLLLISCSFFYHWR